MRTQTTIFSFSLLLLALLVFAGCSDNKPSAPASPNVTNPVFRPDGTTIEGELLAGRTQQVNAATSTIILQGGMTEVIVNSGAEIMQAQADQLTPFAMTAIQAGDSVEFLGSFAAVGNAKVIPGRGTRGGTEIRNDDTHTRAIFVADAVTVIYEDSIPGGTSVYFIDQLASVNVEAGTVTFSTNQLTGKSTASTYYAGPWMGPAPPTLQNFVPGMWVQVAGQTAPGDIVLMDSLIWAQPPDTTNPPDTLPNGTSVAFYATVATVSDLDSTITFNEWPFTGVVTPSSLIIISSFKICAGLEGCITPDMRVFVAGRTDGDWRMIIDSLVEITGPPDTTDPGDSTVVISYETDIAWISHADSTVAFTTMPYFGLVTPDTYLGGEMLPPITLASFSAGMHVWVTGTMNDADTGVMILTAMVHIDIQPPDSSDPGDSTIIPPDTTVPPDSGGFIPITGLLYVRFTALTYDSLGSQFPLFVKYEFETEQLEACPNAGIAANWYSADTLITFDLLGIPPYECFAHQPGPAKLVMQSGFRTTEAAVYIRYKGQTDVYKVSRGPNGETEVTTVLQNFTRLK